MLLLIRMKKTKLVVAAIVLGLCVFVLMRHQDIYLYKQSVSYQEKIHMPGAMQNRNDIIQELLLENSNHFMLSNNNICRTENNFSMIILIHSAPTHFAYRSAIRSTWGNYSLQNQHDQFRRVFLFGRVTDPQLQDKLVNENMMYQDIIQGNFIDSYRNLSLNTLYGLMWVNKYCKIAKVVMKVDDDVVVDIYNVFQRVVLKYTSATKHVFCYLKFNERIIRDININSRLFVEKQELFALEYFPPYCEGKVVIFTSDLVYPILQQAVYPPFFWIEDVFVYGFVMMKLPNLSIDRFWWGVEMDLSCGNEIRCVSEDKTCRKLFVELQQNIVPQITNIWNVFNLRYNTCETS